MPEFGNPYFDDCPELLILNSRDCADDSVFATVSSIETIATALHQQYCQDVIWTGQNQTSRKLPSTFQDSKVLEEV